MFNRYIKNIIIFTLLLIIAVPVLAFSQSDKSKLNTPLDFGLEFTLNGGYNSNVMALADSSDVEDSYATSSIKLKMYPVSSLELTLYGDYTHYRNEYYLRNLSKGVALTFIPTKLNSRFSVYLSGSFGGLTYQEQAKNNNSNSFNLFTSFGYNLSQRVSIRTGVSLKTTAYLFSDVSDNSSHELFAGINFTFLGSNCLDIEAGYSKMNFYYIRDTTYFPNLSPIEDLHVNGDLESFYIAPRFSKPLGSKTGITLSFHHKKFSNCENAVVIGPGVYTISTLGDIYEGQAYTVSLKTKLIPKMIISFGGGYWKKAYLKTIVTTSYWLKYAEKRYEEQNRFFFILERPIFFKSGSILKPKLQIDIKNNNTKTYSMWNFYDYSSFSINLSMTYQL